MQVWSKIVDTVWWKPRAVNGSAVENEVGKKALHAGIKLINEPVRDAVNPIRLTMMNEMGK